ncbi:MAG: glycosyltransferase family 2 protein [Bacillota bacterium]|nr:glycosyltransferase family 2 protein [Bacillota bacterium]
MKQKLKKYVRTLLNFVPRLFGGLGIKNKEKSNPLEKVGIAAIVKNEAEYIEEWVLYHLTIGFDEIVLYDNGSEDNSKEILEPYVKAGKVRIIDYPGMGKQLEVYNYAIQQLKNEFKYLAFIDADEFLLPMHGESIKSLLDKMFFDEKVGGLAINWKMFGSSGLEEKPEGGVLKNFLYCANKKDVGNECIKSIVNPRKVFAYQHPHFPTYYYGYKSYDENKQVVSSWKNYIEPEVLRINHYFTKSKAEWIKRRGMPRVDSKVAKYRTLDEFYAHDNNDQYDDKILVYLPKMEELKTKMNS